MLNYKKVEPFNCPIVLTLSLDGYYFLDICWLSNWKNAFKKKKSIDSLSLSYVTVPRYGSDKDNGDDENPLIHTLAKHLSRIGHIQTPKFARISMLEGFNLDEGTYYFSVDNLIIVDQDLDWLERGST